jgi:hypothetical protein
MAMHLSTMVLTALLLAGYPFALLGTRLQVSESDRRALERGDTVSGILPGGKDQVAVFAIAGIDVEPEVLIASARSIEDLKRSTFVKAIHRFSEPPQLEDLAALELAPRDVEAAIACRPGDCLLKLTDAEIEVLRPAVRAGANREDRIQDAFRRIVLARVRGYLAGAATPSLDMPGAPAWLVTMPSAAAEIESFIYWSQELYSSGRPVVLVTHVSLLAPRRPEDPAIVVGQQIMATRYMTGGFSITGITTDPSTGRRYLIYLNRSGVDLVGGVFGPIRRSILESRLKRQVPEIIQKLRQRLERQAQSATR